MATLQKVLDAGYRGLLAAPYYLDKQVRRSSPLHPRFEQSQGHAYFLGADIARSPAVFDLTSSPCIKDPQSCTDLVRMGGHLEELLQHRCVSPHFPPPTRPLLCSP